MSLGRIAKHPGYGTTGHAAPVHTNPVVASIEMGVGILRVVLCLWTLGLLCAAVKAARLPAPSSWFVVLLPLWLGNLVLAVLQTRFIFRVVSCFTRGRVVSEADYRLLLRSAHPSEVEWTITEDQTHLITRSTAGVILSMPALFLVTASEIMVCNFLDSGEPGIWISLSPLLFVELLCVIQFVLIKSNSWRLGVAQFLIFATTVSIASQVARMEGGSSQRSLSASSWAVALAPLWTMNLVFLQMILDALWKSCVGLYELRAQQILCCALYVSATILTMMGEVLLVFQPWGDSDPVSSLWLPLGTLMFGVFVFAVAVFLIIEEHGDWLLSSRGFGEPLPLSLTEEGGWEPSGEEKGYELALGILGTNRPMGNQAANRFFVSDASPFSNDYQPAVKVENVHSDTYDSGCDSSAFNDVYGGNTTGASSGVESS
mmetsp:Transcript_25579/g.57371  ORF Transcript_25579/g.57371 Transcript_25579/m.57371 type:complete len:430 (+) Transcript_25579:149-1438(+)|eukprot:CAMPEP_0172619920 /NCGR_PEP_ID=MMETSP1068-20121228/98457_1 /TAXON_ID=35684 /ORGANISM="Pseudopedinella elastica, Strain CCMP716" /LENGTH=429 /DNA_ID=CAMNT_0013426927 /DNA_START=81 /DNA_END=1370 /DNA_ORIENTATION=-